MAQSCGCCLVLCLLSFAFAYEEMFHGHFTDEFGVEMNGNLEDLENLANDHGLLVKRQLTSLGNVYVVSHRQLSRRSKRSAEDILDILKKDPRVSIVEQQMILKRIKRRIVHDKQWELPIDRYKDKSIYQRYTDDSRRRQAKNKIPTASGKLEELGFNDPYFPDQWYLINEGQTGGLQGYDVNVLPVWAKGFSGEGVVVSILDDGVDHTHPDLKENFDPEASADMNDREDEDNDPMPNFKDSSNSHGTRCAGEVAAKANNSNCGVGIAFNARIGGVRMLDGTVTDLLEAEALTYQNQYIDIYSASWGPSDDGKTIEGPGQFAKQALKRGVTEGRGGLGSIYVWATGNGGMVDDDCSCDGYVSSIYTLSVGCISDHGLSTYFSEVCPSTMAVIFTGGAHDKPGLGRSHDNPKIKVVTTDLDGDCTLEFQGTSSAAPLAAGCFALVLEANPNLTWRDMQNIVVETARIPNAEEEGWTVNGAGHHVNHKFGFGAIDCGKMVEVAQTWQTVAEQHQCIVPKNNSPGDIIGGETLNQTLETDGCHGDSRVTQLEHTQVHVRLTHAKRGDLSIKLYSPSGTVSEILSLRPLDDSEDGLDFTFMTVHNWGEDPTGVWTLSVTDMSDSGRIFRDGREHHKRGSLLGWSLILWGVESDSGTTVASSKRGGEEPAHEAQKNEIQDIMASEDQASENLQIKDQSEEALTQADLNLLNQLFSEEKEQRQNARIKQRYHLEETENNLMNRLLRTLGGQPEAQQLAITNNARKWAETQQQSKSAQKRRRKQKGRRMYQKVNMEQRSLLDDAIKEYFPKDNDKTDEPKKQDEVQEARIATKDSSAQQETDVNQQERDMNQQETDVNQRGTDEQKLDRLLKEIDQLLELLEED